MIINSLLDTDLYKLTMMQGVFHQFKGVQASYAFTCRTAGVDFRTCLDQINDEIDHLCTLSFSEEDLGYLKNLRYIHPDFTDYLADFHLKRSNLALSMDRGDLLINISGAWLDTILFEVPVLAIVNESYFTATQPDPDWTNGRKKLQDKIHLIREAVEQGIPFSFSDFGTRRRFSRNWHKEILSTLKKELPAPFAGTSNVDLAKALGLTPVGTMAHEWLMAAQALSDDLRFSQVFALEHWLKEYPEDLGIALSDAVGFEAFLKDFSPELARRFNGCRHDSGDPLAWGDRLIGHYIALGIDPKEKVAIFSDGLSVPKALDIARYFKGRITTAFGIGTNLTNDVSGDPIQIVIKMTHCQGKPVAKLSDSSGKQMSVDRAYLDRLTRLFKGETP
jgi:nicotinate phosphoribosyltransferase